MRLPETFALRWSLWFALSLVCVAVACGLVWAGSGREPLQTDLGRAFVAGWLAVWLFLTGLGLLKLFLRLEWAPLSVARTLLDEAVRMRLAVGFIAVLIFALAVLPATQSPDTPLRYRIQTFLSFGLGLTATLLSLLTVFLSCASLSHEIQDQRIFSVVTKPIGRGAYLLGKWLGLMLLNGLLLGVAGVLLIGFTLLLAREPGIDPQDAQAVDREVLVARESVQPVSLEPLEIRAQARLDKLRASNAAVLQELGEDATYAQLLEQERNAWRNIEPRGRATFVFEDLRAAKAAGREVQVRYLLRVSKEPPDGVLAVGLLLNGRAGVLTSKVNVHQLLAIAPDDIQESGRVELTIVNLNPRNPKATPEATLSIPPGNGLEALWERGGFVPNFARGAVILWIKLGFLAMCGLAAGAFLSFPVAALLTLAVFVIATASGFLVEALGYFGDNERSAGLKTATAVVRWAGLLLAELLGPYSRYAPGERVVDGRIVPWSDVAGCLGWIGVLWTGLAAAVAWLVFRARELARVQV